MSVVKLFIDNIISESEGKHVYIMGCPHAHLAESPKANKKGYLLWKRRAKLASEHKMQLHYAATKAWKTWNLLYYYTLGHRSIYSLRTNHHFFYNTNFINESKHKSQRKRDHLFHHPGSRAKRMEPKRLRSFPNTHTHIHTTTTKNQEPDRQNHELWVYFSNCMIYRPNRNII
jgi:hypothetical protein